MKHEYPCEKGVPTKGKENKIFPEGTASKKNKTMEKSLFSADKMSSEVGMNSKFKSSSKSKVDKSVHKYKDNTISPTSNY